MSDYVVLHGDLQNLGIEVRKWSDGRLNLVTKDLLRSMQDTPDNRETCLQEVKQYLGVVSPSMHSRSSMVKEPTTMNKPERCSNTRCRKDLSAQEFIIACEDLFCSYSCASKTKGFTTMLEKSERINAIDLLSADEAEAVILRRGIYKILEAHTDGKFSLSQRDLSITGRLIANEYTQDDYEIYHEEILPAFELIEEIPESTQYRFVTDTEHVMEVPPSLEKELSKYAQGGIVHEKFFDGIQI